MKEQRWPGDYQSVPQEQRSARREEQTGMTDVNKTLGNDYLAQPTRVFDAYQIGELEPSWTTQLDTSGMQPHSREFLERDMTGMVSGRKFHAMGGQMIDYCEGIQFSGTP
jgi:hypothetical protein